MKSESDGRRQNEECRSGEKLGSGIRAQPLGRRGLRQLWGNRERRQIVESELTVRREARRAGFEFRCPHQTVFWGWLGNLVEREQVIKFLTVRNLVSPGAESLFGNYEGCCGEGFWLWSRRRGRSIPAAGCDDRTNAGHGQKTRRPEGFRGKGRLASLLLSRRSTRDILLRRASPSGLFPENSAPRSFQTGSKGRCAAEIRRRKPDSRNSETQEWDSWNSPLRIKSQSHAWVTLYIRKSCEMHEMVRTRSRRFRTSVNRPNPTTPTQAKGKLR